MPKICTVEAITDGIIHPCDALDPMDIIGQSDEVHSDVAACLGMRHSHTAYLRSICDEKLITRAVHY